MTTAYTSFELVCCFRSVVLSALREIHKIEHSYENYLIEMRGRLQSAREVARQKLVSSQEKSKKYYDKDSETFEVKTR